MKLRILSTLIVLAITGNVIAQEKETYSFNLQECIEFALENSTLVENSKIEREIAQKQVNETVAIGLPQINADAGITYNYLLQKSFVDPSEFNFGGPDTTNGGSDLPEEIEIAFGVPYQGNASVTLNQLIFDGSYFVGLQAAKTYKQLSEKQHIKSEIDLVEAVSKAYYTTLVNKERLDLLAKNFTRLDTLLYETEIMYNNGFAEKIDVNRIKIQYNLIKTEYENTKRLLNISYDLLKFQMGMPISNTIDLKGNISEISFEFGLSELNPMVDKFNYSQRIEVQQWQVNREIAQLELKNNKVKYYPTLSAFASYGYNTGSSSFQRIFNANRWLNYGGIGLNLSVPIFDGMAKANRIQQNKLQIEQLENQRDFLHNQIDFEINEAKVNLINSIEKLQQENENKELAQEVYDVTTLKYQEGLGSNLEVVEAETAYKEAETNYFNALFDALIAKVDLEKALGILEY